MTFIGIDPGLSGSIAIHSDTIEILKMPEEHDKDVLVDIIKSFSDKGPVKVIIEKQITKQVQSMKPCPKCRAMIPYLHPQKGVRTSLINYGIILGILISMKIPYEEVDGSKWKKYYKLEGGGKKASIALAKQLFPEYAKQIGSDDNKAEAMLLADYGRRQC